MSSELIRCPACGMEAPTEREVGARPMGSPGTGCWWLERELAAGNTDAVRKLACPNCPCNQPRLS